MDLDTLKRIVEIEYGDVANDSVIHHGKLRLFIVDGSVVDIWFSNKISGRFAYHWERRLVDGKIFRHDNFPDPRWKVLSTFPKHFHNGSQDNVQESKISDDPESGVREFMDFVRMTIKSG